MAVGNGGQGTQFVPNALENKMYDSPFFITDEISNNRFHFRERKNPKIRVADLIQGTYEDVREGSETAFEDFDDDGNLRSFRGLDHFIKTKIGKTTAYIFDNHNHAFFFWHQAYAEGQIKKGATLVHIDQHKDTREPDSYLDPSDMLDLKKVFAYTNTTLNVGNFIHPAIKDGLLRENIILDSEESIDHFNLDDHSGDMILDLDLDFFSPEMEYIAEEKKLGCIRSLIPKVKIVTIAFSPFFIEFERARLWLKKVAE